VQQLALQVAALDHVVVDECEVAAGVFGSATSGPLSPQDHRPLSDWPLVQSHGRTEVVPLWVGTPALPLAIPSALRFSLGHLG
jgi:hypothetical protein